MRRLSCALRRTRGAERVKAGSCARAPGPFHAAGLRKLAEALQGAVDKEDARALASLWTEEGEYIGEHGIAVRGRSGIEKAYGLNFGKNHRAKLQLHIDSIRFVARASAIIEGRA